MSYSTCDTTTCAPCSPYDNCGCLNPSTFACTTVPGICEALEITNDMNGQQVIAQICSKYEELLNSKGLVLIDSNDTCPDHLFDKLQEGLNISFTQTGTGCSRRLIINAVDGGTPIDINTKVSSADTTTGYLTDKIDGGVHISPAIINPGANEKLRLNLVLSTLLSVDSGNQLTLGADGKLKTSYSAPDGSETKIVQGSGVTVSGIGTTSDPYVVSTNPSISVARSCFDSIWRTITLVATGNPNVVFTSGAPQYRYRFDGTLEFRGSATYTVAFGAYSSANRKFTFTAGNIPTTCITLAEQIGTADLKGINYIDVPQSGDQMSQQYGYIIRKSANNILLELQSSFTSPTSKTIVVNFDGAISHPQI